MSTVDKSLVKNAPLLPAEDRNDFVEWATSFPDGSMSAGWQSLHPHLAGNRDKAWVTTDVGGLKGHAHAETSRRSLAKFVELSRRRLGQSLEQLAENVGLDLGELLAVETGKGVIEPETVQRLGVFLGVNPQRLQQLAGLIPGDNRELEQAALHFAARTESIKPLEPQEEAALERFCVEVFAVESSGG